MHIVQCWAKLYWVNFIIRHRWQPLWIIHLTNKDKCSRKTWRRLNLTTRVNTTGLSIITRLPTTHFLQTLFPHLGIYFLSPDKKYLDISWMFCILTPFQCTFFGTFAVFATLIDHHIARNSGEGLGSFITAKLKAILFSFSLLTNERPTPVV